MNWSDRLKVVFAGFLAVQFLTVVLHDLVDIPGWTHDSQVQAVIGRQKALWATAINSVFPGVALALAIYALVGPVPAVCAAVLGGLLRADGHLGDCDVVRAVPAGDLGCHQARVRRDVCGDAAGIAGAGRQSTAKSAARLFSRAVYRQPGIGSGDWGSGVGESARVTAVRRRTSAAPKPMGW